MFTSIYIQVYVQIKQLLLRSWLVALFMLLIVMAQLAQTPLYGADATPTPDVSTVPKPSAATPTPENTPLPTPTAISDADNSDSGNDNSENGEDAVPTLPSPQESDDDNVSDGSSTTDGAPNGGASADDAPVSSDSAPTGDNTEPASGMSGIVAMTVVKLQKAPGATNSIVDTLFQGDLVEIQGRDKSGIWWYVCCGAGARRAGWVDATAITPNFEADQAMDLLPILATANNATPANNRDADALPEALQLEMRPSPAFVWQGQIIKLEIVITNRSKQPVDNVQLRNDLPPELQFIEAQTGNGILRRTGAAADGQIFTIDWPKLDAGAQVKSTITLRVAANVANGALIDNLAVVKAAGSQEALAGITLAMPPTHLPLFR